MDLSAPLIFVSIFILASLSLFFVYKYGIKKKSYEEVLAEQRKQASALLGPRPKPKEKKMNKKAAKKLNKEKAAAINAANVASESEVTEGTDGAASASENVDSLKSEGAKVGAPKEASKTSSNKHVKAHVEFKEEPEEVPAEAPVEKEIVKEPVSKKRSKKVKPILVNKASDPEVVVRTIEPPPVENHFDEIHPKDEFELMRSASKEDISQKSEPAKEEARKPSKKNKHQKTVVEPQQQQLEKPQTEEPPVNVAKEKPKEEKVAPSNAAPFTQELVVPHAGKEKKKKKSEYSSRPQLTAERDQLIHSVRNAELSRTEVQLLIDLLLNKQLEAPAVIDDWSEGKSDPIQKLKKQLAEKEKQLADEQETLAGVQAKLKEVRNEQLAERAQLQQKVRAAEESKLDIVAAHNRLQQKIQEMEEFHNKELLNFQRLAEENKALQMQRAQLEATLITYQETDAVIHSLKAENLHLNKQCQLLTQQRQEQDTNYQNCVMQIQTLERNQAFALTAQQEEIRKKHEQQLHRLTESNSIEQQMLQDIIMELKTEIQKLKEESSVQVNGSSEENKEHEVKLLNLTNELTSVKSELTSVSQSLLDAERKYKSELTITQEKYSALQGELEEQKSKNDQLTSDIITKEQNAHKEFLQRLFPEIQVSKSKPLSDWQRDFESAVRDHIARLGQKSEPSAMPETSSEVIKLQNEVQHYKQIIDETEGILKKLESHIEEEERNWRNKLSQKDAEIQELRDHCTTQLQTKVTHLESQLEQEREEKRLLEERQQVVEKPDIKTIHSDSTLVVERLSEEVDRLRELLRLEQIKNSEAGIYQNGATS